MEFSYLSLEDLAGYVVIKAIHSDEFDSEISKYTCCCQFITPRFRSNDIEIMDRNILSEVG
jgi:hypothetical protein